MTKKCSTPECPGASKTHGKCANCYQRMYYWNDATIGEKMEHMKKLRIRESTMSEMTNVTLIGRRRRRV